MQCPETARCLPAYIVDELVPSERETFEAHLLGCGGSSFGAIVCTAFP